MQHRSRLPRQFCSLCSVACWYCHCPSGYCRYAPAPSFLTAYVADPFLKALIHASRGYLSSSMRALLLASMRSSFVVRCETVVQMVIFLCVFFPRRGLYISWQITMVMVPQHRFVFNSAQILLMALASRYPGACAVFQVRSFCALWLVDFFVKLLGNQCCLVFRTLYLLSNRLALALCCFLSPGTTASVVLQCAPCSCRCSLHG